MGIFAGSGLADYGVGDLLGTRDRANSQQQQRRLLSLILQTASQSPDLQAYMPGFALAGPSETEQPLNGFLGLGAVPGMDMLLGSLGLGGGTTAGTGVISNTGPGSNLRRAMTVDDFLNPSVFGRKAKTKR